MSRRARKGDPKIAVAVGRVSTQEQQLGPLAQKAACEAFAVQSGVSLVAWFCDTVTGASELAERPGLVAALAAVREHGAGLVVFHRRDRLARDPVVAGMIERAVEAAGARVVCADGAANGDSPADAFMRSVLDAASAYERAILKARTKQALAALRARGRRAGEVPFGFKVSPVDGKTLEPDDREMAVVREVLRYRDEGLSLRCIARALEKAGHRGRTGSPLSSVQVLRVIRRAAQAGYPPSQPM